MKINRILRICKTILAVVAIAIIINKIFVYVIVKYGGYSIKERLLNGTITGFTEIQPESELEGALVWFNNWDDLFLSNNFKNKFKNRRGIIENIDDYDNISGFYSYDNGVKYLAIYADKKKTFLDFFNQDYDDISTEFYFDYKIDDKGWLDDVDLIKKIDIYTSTGLPVEE